MYAYSDLLARYPTQRAAKRAFLRVSLTSAMIGQRYLEGGLFQHEDATYICEVAESRPHKGSLPS